MSDFDLELQKAQEEAARSRRTAKWTMLGLALLSIFLTGAVTVAFWLAATNSDLAAENASFGQQQQGEKKEIAKEAAQALCGQGDRQIYDRDLCAKWADAAQEPTVTVETAPALPGAPSQADLVAAFREYCADGNCKGRDGQTPTPDDIAAAFVTFCADGRCVGPAGGDGKDGADGKPLAPQYETVLAAVTEYCTASGACVGPSGADGANATQDMVLAAVQTVCANDACRGPAGPPGGDSTVPGPQGETGPAGPQGEPGRGVHTAYCGDDSRWLITYTDGATSDGGQCRTPPLGGTL